MDLSSSIRLNSGHQMPRLGLGTWLSKPGEVRAAVEFALRQGYKHVDCASIYFNEKDVGEGIRDSGVARKDIFVTSKLWNNKHHPDDVEGACRKTLADLGLDYLDLYLMHFPVAFQRGEVMNPLKENGDIEFDETIHPTDTWLAMENLVDKGLVRSIGVSNFNSVQIQDIIDKGSIVPAINQVECHPFFSQAKLREFCNKRGIEVTAYSPLVNGRSKILEDPRLKEIASVHGKSTAQVLIRWHIQRNVIVIPKSVIMTEIEENKNIFDFSLSESEMDIINSFNRNERIVIPMVNGKIRDLEHKHYPFNIEF